MGAEKNPDPSNEFPNFVVPKMKNLSTVLRRQCCRAGAGEGAAILRATPEMVPILLWVGAQSRSRLFKAAPAVSFMKAKKALLWY